MKDCGKTTYNMEWARKLGLMGLSMRASIWEERSMALESTVGMMVPRMKENGMRTRSKV